MSIGHHYFPLSSIHDWPTNHHPTSFSPDTIFSSLTSHSHCQPWQDMTLLLGMHNQSRLMMSHCQSQVYCREKSNENVENTPSWNSTSHWHNLPPLPIPQANAPMMLHLLPLLPIWMQSHHYSHCPHPLSWTMVCFIKWHCDMQLHHGQSLLNLFSMHPWYNWYCALLIEDPELWAFYKKHDTSFWTPEEIDFSDDMKHLPTLLSDQVHFLPTFLFLCHQQ
jgi:hypothetical protein